MQQLSSIMLLLQNGGLDSNQIMQNIFIFIMNNYQSIIKKINKILADLSINRIEAPNKLTNNDTIDNKIDVSDSSESNKKINLQNLQKKKIVVASYAKFIDVYCNFVHCLLVN